MKRLVLVLLLAGVALLCFFGGRWYIDNRLPNFAGEKVLFVYPDTGPQAVLDSLSEVVKRPGSLKRMFERKEVARFIRPGHYVVKPGYTSVYVARMLNNCWQEPVNLTLSGTLRRKDEIARKIASQMMVDSATVYSALNDDALLSEFGFNSANVFALLVPDTYQMYWTEGVEEILARQKQAYDAFWTGERLAKAEALGLTRAQVAILASIVKGETNYEPEMPRIASVYLNRLRIGMRLQADPTIAYCLDYEVNRILRRHLTIDSPYNTYIHAGLPPGPIYVPTKASLDAVLNPDKGSYLYFCADPSFNGSHRFAATYAEHLKNARAFQKALNERQKS